MNFQKFLETTPEFAAFTNEQLTLLEKTMLVKKYPAGHVFFKEDSVGSNIYLIVDGQVTVSHKRGKKYGDLEIKTMHPGEWFGLVSILGTGRHEATCTAKTEVTVASLPQSAFTLLYTSNIQLAHQIHKLITHQVIRDHRALLALIRKSMTTIDNTDDKQNVLETIHMQYRGAERRRKAERRGTINN